MDASASVAPVAAAASPRGAIISMDASTSIATAASPRRGGCQLMLAIVRRSKYRSGGGEPSKLFVRFSN